MSTGSSVPPEPISRKVAVDEFRRRAGEAILGGVDRALLERWEPAKQRAAEITGATRDDQVKAVTAVFARELGAIGAATGALAACRALLGGENLPLFHVEL